ncbi:MAG: hypothetical protein JST36_06490 [Bacteroidetes bacterium]|nr:hypothetical protein [Bacteroidota bacterium]
MSVQNNIRNADESQNTEQPKKPILYPVRPDDPVFLSVFFGEAGVAVTSDIYFKRRYLLRDFHKDIVRLELGKGAAILGERLRLFSVLSQTELMGAAKFLRLEIKVEGGVKTIQETFEKSIGHPGDSYQEDVPILFIRASQSPVEE